MPVPIAVFVPLSAGTDLSLSGSWCGPPCSRSAGILQTSHARKGSISTKKRCTQSPMPKSGSACTFSQQWKLFSAIEVHYNLPYHEHTPHERGASDDCLPELHRWPFAFLRLAPLSSRQVRAVEVPADSSCLQKSVSWCLQCLRAISPWV